MKTLEKVDIVTSINKMMQRANAALQRQKMRRWRGGASKTTFKTKTLYGGDVAMSKNETLERGA